MVQVFLTSSGLPLELGLQLWRGTGRTRWTASGRSPILVEPQYGVPSPRRTGWLAAWGFSPMTASGLRARLLYTLSHNQDLGHVFLPCVAAGRRQPAAERGPLPGSALLAGGWKHWNFRGKVKCQTVAGQDAVYRYDLYEADRCIAWRVKGYCRRGCCWPPGIETWWPRCWAGEGIAYALSSGRRWSGEGPRSCCDRRRGHHGTTTHRGDSGACLKPRRGQCRPPNGRQAAQ